MHSYSKSVLTLVQYLQCFRWFGNFFIISMEVVTCKCSMLSFPPSKASIHNVGHVFRYTSAIGTVTADRAIANIFCYMEIMKCGI